MNDRNRASCTQRWHANQLIIYANRKRSLVFLTRQTGYKIYNRCWRKQSWVTERYERRIWEYLHKNYEESYHETNFDNAFRYKYVWSSIHYCSSNTTKWGFVFRYWLAPGKGSEVFSLFLVFQIFSRIDYFSSNDVFDVANKADLPYLGG